MVLNGTLLVVQKPEWTISRLQRVQAIAQSRIDASDAQGQAFSFIPAALGLISIIGLLLTQEQIRSVLATIEVFLASQLTEQTSTATGTKYNQESYVVFEPIIRRTFSFDIVAK